MSWLLGDEKVALYLLSNLRLVPARKYIQVSQQGTGLQSLLVALGIHGLTK